MVSLSPQLVVLYTVAQCSPICFIMTNLLGTVQFLYKVQTIAGL
jgi:hypothetical protein